MINMTRSRLTISFVALISLGAVKLFGETLPRQASAKTALVDLCLATADPAKFQGRRIRVKAHMLVGRHGALLARSECGARPVEWSEAPNFSGRSRIAYTLYLRDKTGTGYLLIDVDGVFVYRTDVALEKEGPFLFCATKLRSVELADEDVFDRVQYKPSDPPNGPIPAIDPIPCPTE